MLAIGGFAVLFVVLCPLTATPNAVVKVHQTQFAQLLLAVFALAAPLHGRSFSHFIVSSAPLRGQDVIELTCTRLC
jgi:hypothetical protein